MKDPSERKGTMDTSSLGTTSVSHVMTTDVITCAPEDGFEHVAEVLADHDLSGLPVVTRSGELVGVISERDLAHMLGGSLVRLALRRPLHSSNRKRPLDELPRVDELTRDDRQVQTVMSTPPITVHPDTPIHTAAEIMVKEEIGRLPVTIGHRLLGIVTRGDILRGIAELALPSSSNGAIP